MTINRIIYQCFICRHHKGKIQQQLMGQLPRYRVYFVRAFLQTGIDFTGPIQFKGLNDLGAKQFKAYLIVFVCMAAIVVHRVIYTKYGTI